MSNFLRAAASFLGSIYIIEPATSDELSLKVMLSMTETLAISSFLCSKSIAGELRSDVFINYRALGFEESLCG